MSRSILRLLPVAAVAMGVSFSSCKDDDEPTKYQLTFAEETRAANEADGEIEIEIILDKPAPEDIEIDYTVTGTALDEARAQQQQDVQDFEIADDPGEITIEKGETSAKIIVSLFSDGSLEDPETIILTLDKSNNTNVQFEAGEKIEITVNQEDGLIVLLEWPSPSVNGVADMDLLMRVGASASAWEDGFITYSIYRNFTDDFEFVFLPKVITGEWLGLGYLNTTFGLSYTYYDGTLNPLNFSAKFIDVVNGAVEAESGQQVFQATYTDANKNKWTSANPPSVIAQTFTNSGTAFGNFSTPIVVNATGSRMAPASGAEKAFIAPAGNPNFTARIKKLSMPERFKAQLGLR